MTKYCHYKLNNISLETNLNKINNILDNTTLNEV